MPNSITASDVTRLPEAREATLVHRVGDQPDSVAQPVSKQIAAASVKPAREPLPDLPAASGAINRATSNTQPASISAERLKLVRVFFEPFVALMA